MEDQNTKEKPHNSFIIELFNSRYVFLIHPMPLYFAHHIKNIKRQNV